MSNEIITIEKLTRLINRLKPKTVTDLSISSNILNVEFLDESSKQLTLPSGGSSPVTRTVTRVPVYFEIHFKVGEITGSAYEYDQCTADSVLGITAQDVKDIIKVSSGDYSHYSETPAPEGIIVTDVTSTKAYDEFDKVFLVAVNLTNPYLKPGASASITFDLGKSFGNITISDSTIIGAINQARQSQGEEQIQSCGAQIAGGYPELSFEQNDCSMQGNAYNYFEITAYLDNQDLSASYYVYNDWFGYRSTFGGICSFKLQVINKENLDEPVTFTVSE